MQRRLLAAAILPAAMGLAVALSTAPSEAAGMNMPPVVKANQMRMAKEHLEKCYGVNAIGKNDCAQGAHSCAGQATMARDPRSFVLLPAGDCAKIAGGKTTAS